ncbi:hypothetical protein, partial [Nocardia cyriacigeorgica]|uniref:hypothetical protein n=1 Tax=Nocardia cyriacigeorgica TaxID=135487 RepID=UPI0024560A19
SSASAQILGTAPGQTLEITFPRGVTGNGVAEWIQRLHTEVQVDRAGANVLDCDRDVEVGAGEAWKTPPVWTSRRPRFESNQFRSVTDG